RRGLGNGRTGYGLTVIASQGTRFGALHVNLAAAREDYALAENRAANRRMRYRLSIAQVFELSRTWMVAIDAGVTTNPERARRAREAARGRRGRARRDRAGGRGRARKPYSHRRADLAVLTRR